MTTFHLLFIHLLTYLLYFWPTVMGWRSGLGLVGGLRSARCDCMMYWRAFPGGIIPRSFATFTAHLIHAITYFLHSSTYAISIGTPFFMRPLQKLVRRGTNFSLPYQP